MYYYLKFQSNYILSGISDDASLKFCYAFKVVDIIINSSGIFASDMLRYIGYLNDS